MNLARVVLIVVLRRNWSLSICKRLRENLTKDFVALTSAPIGAWEVNLGRTWGVIGKFHFQKRKDKHRVVYFLEYPVSLLNSPWSLYWFRAHFWQGATWFSLQSRSGRSRRGGRAAPPGSKIHDPSGGLPDGNGGCIIIGGRKQVLQVIEVRRASWYDK